MFSTNFNVTAAFELEHSSKDGGEVPKTQEVNRRSNVWETKGPLAWVHVPVSLLTLDRNRYVPEALCHHIPTDERP